MHPDISKVIAEAWLHVGARRRIERLSGRMQHLMDHVRHWECFIALLAKIHCLALHRRNVWLAYRRGWHRTDSSQRSLYLRVELFFLLVSIYLACHTALHVGRRLLFILRGLAREFRAQFVHSMLIPHESVIFRRKGRAFFCCGLFVLHDMPAFVDKIPCPQ